MTPSQAGPRAGAPGEARFAEEVVTWFRALGGQVLTEEVQPGRPNVYATWRGKTDRWVAVDAHMDTVGVEQMTGNPFSGEIANDRVYGRGSVDTKATLAVVLALLEALQQARSLPEPSLLIVASCGEEVEGCGAPAVARWVRAQKLNLDQLIVAEPTLCGPIFGHKGVSRVEVTVTGKSAHSSRPQLGRNAVTAAARVVLAMEEEHQRLQAAPAQTVLGPPTLTVTVIQGGRGVNVVPDSCRLLIDRRIVAGERATEVSAGLCELARRSSPLPVSAEVQLGIEAFLQSPDTPWVRRLAERSGRQPAIAPYCTDAWAYNGLANDCVVLGPGSIDQAHSDEEWVAISELEKLAWMYSLWWGLAV